MGLESSRQSLLLLALINSSLLTLRDSGLVPEMEATVLYGCEAMERIIHDYPTEGRDSLEWYSAALKRIAAKINQPASWYSVESVCALGDMVCADLLSELTSPEKRAFIEEAHEIVKAVYSHVDPDGDNIEALDEVAGILQEVYKEIGFSLEGRYAKHLKKLERRRKRGQPKRRRCEGCDQSTQAIQG